MKLPVKDKYFNDIKSGKKTLEYRDAHLTLVNEKTGEKLTKQVFAVGMQPKDQLPKSLQDSGMFEDDMVIVFYMYPRKGGVSDGASETSEP